MVSATGLLLCCSLAAAVAPDEPLNVHAVIASTSRSWYNYRHGANALGFYRLLQRLGVSDAQISLFLADNPGCNSRNPFSGRVFADLKHKNELLVTVPSAATASMGAEVDYHGDAVTVENFLRVLTGRHPPGTPPSRMLHSDANSSVIIYMTGHGGDKFLKFQNAEEIASLELARALEEMRLKGRYGRLLFIVDTCQAGTLADDLASPNVFCIASSHKDENSFSSQSDGEIGVSLQDRFTEAMLAYFDDLFSAAPTSTSPPNVSAASARAALGGASMQQLLGRFHKRDLKSNVQVRADLYPGGARPWQIPLADFFANPAPPPAAWASGYPLPRAPLADAATQQEE